MSRDVPSSALHLLQQQFDPPTIDAAIALTDDDRVVMVKPLPWPVVARVRDEGGYVVTVNYDPGGRYFSGDCSCAGDASCAHVAATALAALTQESRQAKHKQEVATQSVVATWLAEFGRQQATEPASVESFAPLAIAKPAVLPQRLVAYVLDNRDGDVGLTIMQCLPQTKGGYTAGSPIAGLGDPNRGTPAWVGADDAQRIAMLRVISRATPQASRLRVDRIHTELWRELCDTGRLFWEDTKTAPLHYGENKRDAMRWLPLPTNPDMHRMGLAGANAHLILVPTRDCHYIDVAQRALGPLDLGMSAEIVARLLSGPPVPTAMLATASQSVQTFLRRDEPSPPATVMPPAVRVRMHAALVDVNDSNDKSNAGTKGGRRGAGKRNAAKGAAIALRGEAIYDGDVFSLAVWDAARPITRDMVAEGRLQTMLESWRLRLPHGGNPTSSLDLLADARFVVDVVVPALRAEGWECVLADNFPFEAPLVDVQWFQALRPLGESQDWFALELGVTIAGRTVPLLPILLQAIRNGQLTIETGGEAAMTSGIHLRLPEGESVYVPADRLQRWLRPLVELQLAGLNKRGDLQLPRAVAAQMDLDEYDEPEEDGLVPRLRNPRPDQSLAQARDELRALLNLSPRQERGGFRGTLRSYQRLGVAWLAALHQAGYGGVLADEMGLGKTVQVLAFLDELQRGPATTAPALVVAPRSVVDNWFAETARFAPGLRPVVHLGGRRAEEVAELQKETLVLTSYQTLLRDIDLFTAISWNTIMFDEAQAIKNADSQLRKAAALLRARSRFCITGTPIENHLGELWSQIDMAVPGLLGRLPSFNAVFRRAIEKHGNDERLALLRQRIRPFLLRRRKTQVELELPPKTEIVERIELDTAQRDLYESLRLKLDDRVQKALLQKGIQGSSMAILDALLKLRQCCCDPRLIKLAEARKVTTSAKLERLCDMLQELAASGRKTLVFSQFTSMLELIELECQRLKISYVKLTGETRNRQQVVEAFGRGEVPVFLISLKAGGVGLNLTAADTVIHFDPWWNPAVTAQATDRAHRIGQDKPVVVYKLVARGTLEEAICQLQEEKQLLTDAALQDGGVTSLDAEDLRMLYKRIV